MTRVADIDDDEAPTVLIVDNNQMAQHRLTTIFRQKEFKVISCEDGDKAVDEYIRLDPELVIMSLDIPSLDGHLAALEMREHGGECRILFIAPKHQAELAADATFSAGAIGWIEKPVTTASIDALWSRVLGEVPAAPGLEDLDEIHPGAGELKVSIEEDDGPLPLVDLVSLPNLNLPDIGITPVQMAKKAKKKSSKVKRLLIVFTLFGVLGAAGFLAWKRGLIPF
jgi:CheY-like chemotaxis protein